MNRRKKAMVLILAFIIGVGLITVPAHFSSVSAGENDIYVYKYEGGSKASSKHHFTFQWYNDSSAWERVRNRHHKTQIFELVNTTDANDTAFAYCSDFINSAIAGSMYKRINLEDSTYYNEAAAEHIRAIMDKGYWYTWTDADLQAAEAAANQWLDTYDPAAFSTAAYMPGDAEEPVNKISGLTADEALMATQLAIWAFANTEGDGFWIKYYESIMPEVIEDEDNIRYIIQELPDNVKTFRKYLIHQQARQASPKELVLTDDYFITTSAVFTADADGDTKYDVTALFKLAADIDARDQLTITATAGDNESRTYSLNGSSPMARSANDYYAVTIEDVSMQDIEQGITLSIDGKQWTSGICFYEAQAGENDSAREVSQNLVGRYEGLTPAAATFSLTAEVKEGELDLFKYDASTTVPMEDADCLIDGQPRRALGGAVFDLYVMIDGEYILIDSGLVSGDDGNIHVTGLPEGYEYYFKETAAPEGYEISNTGFIKASVAGSREEATTVFVGNCEQADIPINPDETPDPTEPTDPTTPSDPSSGEVVEPTRTGDFTNMSKYIGILLIALAVMGFAIRRPEYD